MTEFFSQFKDDKGQQAISGPHTDDEVEQVTAPWVAVFAQSPVALYDWGTDKDHGRLVPVSDMAETALVIRGERGEYGDWAVEGLTVEEGEPAGTNWVGSHDAHHTAWFQWLCPRTGRYKFSTRGSTASDNTADEFGNLDTTLAIFEPGDGFAERASNDDVDQDGDDNIWYAELAFNAQAAVNYFIQVGTYAEENVGLARLSWTRVEPLPSQTIDFSIAEQSGGDSDVFTPYDFSGFFTKVTFTLTAPLVVPPEKSVFLTIINDPPGNGTMAEVQLTNGSWDAFVEYDFVEEGGSNNMGLVPAVAQIHVDSYIDQDGVTLPACEITGYF